MPSIDAVVTTLIPEFQLAYARDSGGLQFAITPDTAGTPWNALQEGQRVRLEVTSPPVRVVHAGVFPPAEGLDDLLAKITPDNRHDLSW